MHFCLHTKMDKKQTIDNYRLTSMEDPSDEVLSALMREAAEDAKAKGEAAHKRYFSFLREYSRRQYEKWFADNPQPTFD